MRSIQFRAVGLLGALLLPLMPLAAHAAFSVTAASEDGARVSASSGTSVQGDGETESEADDDVAPILITHANVQAAIKATTNAQTNATDTSAGNSGSDAAANPVVRGGTSAGLETLNPVSKPNISLRSHAEALVSADPHISAISLSPNAVSLSYRVPAKLFGFLTMSVPVKVSVDASGNSTVAYPWYGFLYSTDQTDLAIQAHAAAAEHSAATSSPHTAFSASEEVRLLDALYAALASSANATATAQ